MTDSRRRAVIRKLYYARLPVGPLAVVYAGLRAADYAAGHAAAAVQEQHLLPGFLWFVLGVVLAVGGAIAAMRTLDHEPRPDDQGQP